MGVVYKLKKEITDYILELKRSQPHLSCRSISKIISERFNTTLSKSSVNSVIKKAGLSMPVGRRAKKKYKSRLSQAMPKAEEALTKLLEESPSAKNISEIKKEGAGLPLSDVSSKGMLTAQPISSSPITSEEKQEEKKEERPTEELKPQPPPPNPSPEIKPEEIPIAKEPREEKELTTAGTPIEVIWLPEENVEDMAELPCKGAIILKAADDLLGLSRLIRKAVVWRFGLKLNLKEENLLNRTEALMYAPFFTQERNNQEEPRSFWALIGKKIPWENLDTYSKILESDKTIALEIRQAFLEAVKEVRCIQISFSDRNSIYLDGQLHTIWSTQYLPYDFSCTLQEALSYVDNFFLKAEPLLFFTAPGYDIVPREFFNFLYSQETPQKYIAKVSLLGHKFEELKTIPVPEQIRKYLFVFGMWPWQFVEFRRVKKLGEFKSFYFEKMEKQFYLAETEIELFGPTMQTSVILRGFALKTNLVEKTRLLILSNLDASRIKAEYLVSLYLKSWPNLEEGFQDYSRKIERFTYTANIQRCFTSDNDKLPLLSKNHDITSLFNNCLSSLDLYSRWRFLPRGYEDSPFEATKERFYSLPVILTKKTDYIKASFVLVKEYPFLKDVEYACRRLNECQIRLSEGKSVVFSYLFPK